MGSELKQTKEIRAGYGLVIYNSQLLEQQLILMIFASQLDTKHNLNLKAGKELFGNCFYHTIEKLKLDLRETYQLDSNEVDHLNESLKLRSIFSFKYFGKRTKELYSAAGQQKMIQELESASFTFSQTNHLLKAKFNKYLRSHQMSTAHIQKKVKMIFNAC